MYKPIKNGSVEKIYLYDCNIPPLGYGLNFITGEIAETDILKRSNNKRDQFWERTDLSKDWAKRLKAEKRKQLNDPEFTDSGMDVFRKQEWHRRLHGVWFWNNGVPYFIPAEYYMFLNWWPMDSGYPDYRNADRKRYTVLEYCVQDPRSAGMIDIANRRSGKSYRGGLFAFNYPSIIGDSFGGIQSKTDNDAKSLFKGKLITPFRRLPEFFQPEIDDRTGTSPEKELRMVKSPRRGRAAMQDIGELGLNSFINFLSSDIFSYDGWKLHRYLDDEFGKPVDFDVYERWQIVKYCLRIGKNWIGKSLHTSTTEEIEVDDKKATMGGAKQMWIDSDPRERDPNGHTTSGLYKFYTKAQEIFETDRHGNADEQAGYQFYMNSRSVLQNNPVALEKEISKNTLDESELFRTRAGDCLYNFTKLTNRETLLSFNQQLVEKGNLIWEGTAHASKVLWEPSSNGRWTKRWLPKPEDTNRIERSNNRCTPLNLHNFTSGCDPVDHGQTQDSRGSKTTASVKKRRNYDGDESSYKMHVVNYNHRHPDPESFYEDMILQCVYFGCQMLFESNKPGIGRYFMRKGYGDFLLHLPWYKEPGIPATQENKRDASIMAETYIERNIDKMFFIRQVQQAKEFDIKKTEKYDDWMAFLWTEYADGYRYFDEDSASQSLIDVGDVFRRN